MEDLGDVAENFVEFFRCIEKNRNAVAPSSPTFPPPGHGNLLASSSRYGHLFAAVGEHIIVHSLACLRDRAPGALPVARVDLKPHSVSSVKSVALALDDSALVVHAVAETSADGFVLILHSSALVQGKVILLPSPPEGMQLKFVAVRPQGYDLDSESSSQFVAMLSVLGEVELYSLAGDSASDVSSANFERGLAGPDPLTCVALSPDDEMVAVGSMRGSVSVHATEDISLLTTIVEVESGWHPFALHFLDTDALLVSYACGESISHIVWNLDNDDGELIVNGHSPLGELCFASLPSPPASEDGDEEAEIKNEYNPPVIWCSRIPGWDMCVVASSLSTDVEVIALNDDGLWENWKFDEGKSPTLPTDANDNDTKPVGLAFDLTNTASIESPEPSAPRINPMPSLITFTTDSLLIPFSLIDDRPGAVCDLVRKSLPLPPVPRGNRPRAKVTLPDLDTRDADPGSQDLKLSTSGLDGLPLTESAEGKIAVSLFRSGSSDTPGWNGVATNTDFSAKEGASFVEATHPPPNSSPESQPSTLSRKRQATDSSTSSRDSASSQESVTDEEDLEEAVTNSVNDNSERLQLPQTGFSGQEDFISAFEYAGISESQPGGLGGSTFDTSAVRFTPSAQPKFRTSLFEASKQKTQTNTSSTVSTLVYPTPVVKLEDASTALKSGKPLDLIRSVLLEMAAELNHNREVEKATIKTLNETNSVIVPLVESVRSGLMDILQVLRDRFRHESTLRREVLGSLKRMMTLSREYESTSLEFRVREEEGFSSHLQAEDKAVDEQIAKKEAEVLKSISAIEDRLNTDRIPKDRKVNQSEQIQQMYSSLSLQGIRMRKVHGLLTALSERIDELDKGGRRTDLGLSMARLERLSISHKGTPRTTDEKGGGMRQITVPPEAKSIFKKSFGAVTEMPGNIDGTPISNDVQKVLRRLAMRGGRANISVKAPPNRKGSTVAIQGKRRGLATTREPGSDGLLSYRKDTGDVIKTFDNSGQSVTHVGFMQDTSGSSYDAVDKLAYVVPWASYTDINRSGQPNASAGISSSGKRATLGFEETVPKKNEGWSTTLRGAPNPAGSKKSVPNNFGRAPTVTTELKPKKPMFDSLPPSDFTGKKTAWPSSQPEADLPSFTSAEFWSDSSVANEWLQTESSGSPFGSSLPDQPPLGSAGKKRTKDGEPFSFVSHAKTDIPRKDEKPPMVPTKSSIYASLPPDSFAVDSKTPLGQAVGSPSSPSDEKSSGFVAFLPPDESVKGGTVATLPPDDNKKSTLPPDSSPGAVQKGRVATLPPNDDLHIAQVASLPPDDDLKKDLVATLHPDDNLKGSTVATVSPDDTARSDNAILPPENELTSSLVATLPPDDDIVAASSLEKRPTESGSSPKDGKLAQGLQEQASPAASDARSNRFSMFGSKLSIGGTESAAPFGSKEANQSSSKPQESERTSSGFSNVAAQSQPSQFPFGAGQVIKAVESGSVREPTSDIQGGSSDDSDTEENARSTGAFGMDTTAMTSNVSSQSAFAGFGSQFQSGQNASGASSFGQTSAGVFGNASSHSAPFGVSSMQDSQGMSFGASSAQATSGAPFGSFGASSSSFASSSPFGASSTLDSGTPFGSAAQGGGSQFGGTSQLGGGAQFGASSQMGSQFGASSQLGAGFGAQSQLGGGASPFGGQGGTGAAGFGGGASGFGGGVPAPKFGESSFGTPQQSAFGSSGGGDFDSGGASPFAAMSGSLFGGQSGGGSGFAALAASQPFGESAGSGFGTGTTPVFGNNSGPPSFTSAAFAQRRA